jgi:hypothetical protein
MPELISEKLLRMQDEAKQEESRLIREGKLAMEKGGSITGLVNVEQNLKGLKEAQLKGDRKTAERMEKELDLAVDGVMERVTEGEAKKMIDYVDTATVDRYFHQDKVDMEKVTRERKEEVLGQLDSLTGESPAEYEYLLDGENDDFIELSKAEKNGLESIKRIYLMQKAKLEQFRQTDEYREYEAKKKEAEGEILRLEQEYREKKFKRERVDQHGVRYLTPGDQAVVNGLFDKMTDRKRELREPLKKVKSKEDGLRMGMEQVEKAFLEYQARFKEYVGKRE